MGQNGGMAKPLPNDTKRTAPTPEAVSANKKLLRFAVLMLATIITGMFTLPLQLVTIGFATWAVIVGISALRASWAAKVRGATIVFNVIAIGLTAVLGLSTASVLARWDIEMDRQACSHQAITHSAQLECAANYDAAMTKYLKSLTR